MSVYAAREIVTGARARKIVANSSTGLEQLKYVTHEHINERTDPESSDLGLEIMH